MRGKETAGVGFFLFVCIVGGYREKKRFGETGRRLRDSVIVSADDVR